MPANVWKMERGEMRRDDKKEGDISVEQFPDLLIDSTPSHDLPSLLTKHGLVLIL